ncbi:hypothetical protein [Qipengyuania sp.]|uniref:hypothetical protein n=1 Tax=Qipengyuania sp. TaxID=2004515 RepID=UPI0035C815EC
MKHKLEVLAESAEAVARVASKLIETGSKDHSALHEALLTYRAAIVAYSADPAVSDYVRKDALQYTGETRVAIERIADLIDQLNDR